MNQKDLEKVIIQAKKDLTVEEIKDALRVCSYGGKPVNMDLKAPNLTCWGDDGGPEMVIPVNGFAKGGEIINGKTNT